MKASNPTLNALLVTGNFIVADLYTFVLADGTTLRYTSFDVDVYYSPTTWSSDGPIFKRTKTRTVLGTETDTVSLNIAPRSTDMIGSQTWKQAVCSGRLDGATLTLDQAFMNLQLVVAGTINKFVGNVAQLTISRGEIEAEINSPMELLSVKLPRNAYQDGCLHVLFDAGCTLNAATFAVNNAVASSPTTKSFNTTLAEAANYFTLGALIFTGGDLTGTKRTVKLHQAGGAITLLNPLPQAPDVADTFTIYPGCDRVLSTCNSKFSNLGNFKGHPFIPVPETAL